MVEINGSYVYLAIYSMAVYWVPVPGCFICVGQSVQARTAADQLQSWTDVDKIQCQFPQTLPWVEP